MPRCRSRVECLEGRLLPNLQRAVRGGMDEVVVGREQGQVMPYAKLRQQRINRAHLNAGATTAIAQLRSVDVILPVRAEERQCGKALDDVLASARAGETLKQFLQYEPGG